MTSPYDGKTPDQWMGITQELIKQHSLQPEELLEIAQICWEKLWSTTVGDAALGFPLIELDPPATIVGYFFEKLLSKELASRYPDLWRGGKGSEKDLHCIQDESLSVEIKSSGQLGYKVYGNRSYGQKVENTEAGKKDKSGYYITVNFYGQTLTLLRFGWIDADDWQAQKSATGQMAGLNYDVYKHKLLNVDGAYMLEGPIQLVEGVGPKSAEELLSLGVKTIGQLITATNLPTKLKKFQVSAKAKYAAM